MESDKLEEIEAQKERDFRNATISPFYSDGEPFDGVFYVEGDDEPIIVDSKTTTMGDLERLVNERLR